MMSNRNQFFFTENGFLYTYIYLTNLVQIRNLAVEI